MRAEFAAPGGPGTRRGRLLPAGLGVGQEAVAEDVDSRGGLGGVPGLAGIGASLDLAQQPLGLGAGRLRRPG